MSKKKGKSLSNFLAKSGRAWGLKISLASRVTLVLVKLVAFIFTGFLVLLGEALNSLVDVAITTSLIISVRIGEKGGDIEHPFGHRRIKSVVSLTAAALFISLTSVQLFREAIPRLFNPVASGNYPLLAIYVLGFSFLVNLIPIVFLIPKESRKDISLRTELYDTINDEISLSAAILGIWFYSRGYYIGDPLATMVVATVIVVDGFILIRENFGMLLGKTPPDEVYEEVKRIVTSIEGVLGLHDMIAEYVGPEVIHMDFDLELPAGTTLKESDKIVRKVKRKLQAESTHMITCSIHPCAHRGEERKIHENI